MITVLTILVGLAMLATLGVLLAGVLGMSGGKDGSRRSNLLMRWRIGLQFLALALFVILLSLTRH
ncbi:twin transmembrane helix small protein [Roseomonas sp. HJA6]|uniref:Twin transmembrane helix small protein n=1 Tax=Roseomonas alba TaxID=2846776 RepID=A0ABS7A4C7_9PROT|nr:twin transmembrane helix small protein [Neoroseomonas alba]MBW6397143.1 twin transmembrane helix small protein [Neoroseomonas alba]